MCDIGSQINRLILVYCQSFLRSKIPKFRPVNAIEIYIYIYIYVCVCVCMCVCVCVCVFQFRITIV